MKAILNSKATFDNLYFCVAVVEGGIKLSYITEAKNINGH